MLHGFVSDGHETDVLDVAWTDNDVPAEQVSVLGLLQSPIRMKMADRTEGASVRITSAMTPVSGETSP